ncbi:hypothetical protein UlMin_042036 [Ulmus minor]
MAISSSSSSISTKVKTKYDVFISFRGEDTRHGFTSHLSDALRKNKVRTYVDQVSLNRGEEISCVLLRAIEESKMFVIVFSENYANSSWCLDELLMIMKCKEENGQEVVPIFYHVDPSCVREQKGSYGTAFVKLEQRFKYHMEKLQAWRIALTKAANLSGWCSQQIRSESVFVQQVVEHVIRKLKSILSISIDDLSMAVSSSAAADPSLHKYDVFISCSGETRNSFTSHLYSALRQKQIKAYADEVSLEIGDGIPRAVPKAIEESAISIIIFSKDYASFRWCLDELVHIIECRHEKNQIVLPIFYGIEPNLIRNQKGAYGAAFCYYEESFKDKMDKVQEWRQALSAAAGLSGWESRNQ